MGEMPLMAATAWAQAHAAESKDPVAFGAKVARVYLAAEAIKYHGCKDTSSELEATILREAGFGDPTPPKNGGDANAEGAAQPHKPTPSLNARAADALAAANKGQVIRTPVAPAAALAALSGWLGAAGKTILASLSTWREPRASRSSGRNPK